LPYRILSEDESFNGKPKATLSQTVAFGLPVNDFSSFMIPPLASRRWLGMMKGMSEPVDLLGLYLHLAQASQRRQRPHVRDRLLVIAGVIATRMDLEPIAAFCRHVILQHNPHHLLKRWPTLADAMQDDGFQHFLKQLQRRYPQERAERMLSSLGIDMARERQSYYSDTEYAAALLGQTPQSLQDMFGERDSD
jgi:hypothetical protein